MLDTAQVRGITVVLVVRYDYLGHLVYTRRVLECTVIGRVLFSSLASFASGSDSLGI